MNRVVYIVDGFNVYHSLVQAQQVSHESAKWLDLTSLCKSYLHLLSCPRGEKAELEHIYYFSASPTHRSQDKQHRHALYMKCLSSCGITVQLGRFKVKELYCPLCQKKYRGFEEKETDVAIATCLFQVCQADEADTVVLVTGDTDLSPTVRVCQRLFPEKNILFAFPYLRQNAELKHLAPRSFGIKLKSYLTHQFPNPLVLEDGTIIDKPLEW